MKKLIIISLVIMFVAVAAHGVYLSKTVNSLSNIVLIVLVKGHCHANQEHMSPFLQWENVMKSNLG